MIRHHRGQPTAGVLLLSAISTLSTIACNAPAPPEGTGGTDAAPEPDCGRGVVVSSSDYQSTNVSLVSITGDVLSPSFISSGSESVGLTAPLSGDISLPSARPPDGRVVLIDAYPASVLTWVDVETAEVTAQLPVGTGFVANPHDYVELSPTKVYVPRYEENPNPGREPFDEGNDVLIVDPSVPAITGRIDMTPAMQGEPEDFLPRADKVLVVGERAYVLLGSRARKLLTREAAFSRIVVVDTRTDTIESVHVLEGMLGCAGFALSPDQTKLAVSCCADCAGDEPLVTEEGLVVLALDEDPIREIARFPAVDYFEGPLSFWPDFVSDETVVVGTYGRDGSGGRVPAADTLVEVRLDEQAARVVLRSEDEPFTIGEARCSCDACFVADADRSVLHRFEISDGRLGDSREIVVDREVALPPRLVGGF